MSSLEGRVRGALRATADEITPSDVPPLAITHNDSASPVAPAGNSRPGNWRRWGVPLAAAAAVLAVLAATAGIVRIVDSGAGRGTGKPATSSAPPYGSVATLTQGLVDQFLTASGPQYTASAVFESTVVAPAENLILLPCLAAHGFRPPPGTVVLLLPPVREMLAGGILYFPDLTEIAKAGTLPGWGTPIKGQPFPSPAYETAYNGCVMSGSNPFQVMDQYGSSLYVEFRLQVEAIQSSAPVRDTIPGLRACASKYGWPRDFSGKDHRLNDLGDFLSWVSTFIDGPASQGASAATMRPRERHWAQVYVECARPTVTVMERLQLAAQRSFLASHRTRLADLVSLAVAAFDQAH